MLVSQEVPFRKIPGYSRIFLEYLECSPPALRFYHRPPALTAINQFAHEELARLIFPRREMAAILRRQNAHLGTGELTFKNIDKLENSDCFAVVTGQQAGMFAGPLYTIYKALTAVRMAEQLEARGLPCVPVFWMECEDHDLAEITHNTVLGTDGSLHRLDFLDLLFHDTRDSTRSVGSRSLPETVRRAIADYASFLPEGESRGNVQALLGDTYVPGSGLADSFGRLMARLVGRFGLVFFNSSETEAKQLVRSVFQKALADSSAISRALRDRASDLEAAGFHSQVHVPEDSTVVFLQQDGERRSLSRHQGRFALKNKGGLFTLEELVTLCEAAPERFSPNVLLRPLIQDHLFPTAVYIGGPAEIAYFAQAEALYHWFGRPMPVIWPRSSLTLLEPEIGDAMRRAGVAFEDCFGSRQKVMEKLLEAVHSTPERARLKALADEIENTLDAVRPALVIADASLGPALDTARRKVLHHVARLQTKFTRLEASRDSALQLQVNAIVNACYPDGTLQERELGIHGFLARHGMQLLDSIYSLMDLSQFAHRVVTLDRPLSQQPHETGN